MNLKTVVVKVGTSTLSDEEGRIDRDYIAGLAAEVAEQRRGGRRVIVVSSGAIRAGCERLGWQHRPQALSLKQAAAAVGQGRLMELYASAFAHHDLAVGQMLLTRHDAADRARYVNARHTLGALLRLDVVPIVNENDTVAVEEIRFGDNDTLAAQVAVLAHADALVLLTDVEGLLDEDGRVIPRVAEIDAGIRALGGRQGAVGTGGMATKLAAAEMACAAGIRTTITCGRPVSVLGRVLAGERCGTEFAPMTRRLAGRKHWIAYGSTPRGGLTVHPLAETALVDRQKSLLPAGVTAVEGAFERGDIVRLAGSDGCEFARGIVNCSAHEARRVMGLHTEQARRQLDRSDFNELVHRDNLVLLVRPPAQERDHESAKDGDPEGV